MATNPEKEPISAELDIVTGGALEAIERASIDVQIATARKYPRSMTLFKERALAMATLDQETAESCIYVRPVGKEKNPATGKYEMKYAEGLSIRAAEIVAASYGNIRVGSMIIDQIPRKVTCRGVAHDLETNYFGQSECIEATVTKDGQPYSERQSAVVAKACLSKAYRDAVFRVVPKALFKSIENECRRMIAGDGKSFDQRRAAAVQWVTRLGIDPVRAWAALNIEGPDDLTPEHLLTLTGLRTAIKDKETTADEAFPPIIPQGNIGQKPAQTPTEAAAAEKQKEKAPPETTKEPVKKAPRKTDSEPPKSETSAAETTAESLVTQLIQKAAALNATRGVLQGKLQELGILTDDEVLSGLDAEKLQLALDRWEEIEALIVKKE